MNSGLSGIHQLSRMILDRVTGAEYPTLYFNPKGEIQKTLGALPQLQQKYRPTPWLSNTHAHLLYFDLIRKRQIKVKYDHFDQLQMQDGGITGIMWLGYDLPDTTPTVVVMHTITGSPESMAELVRDLNRYTGWRIALCLRRGHANLPLPVPKINLFGFTEDLREQVAFIQARFAHSTLFAVGSSAGTGLLVRYLGEEGQHTPFKAAFALCPGYDTELGFVNIHPFYSKLMTKKLFKKFILPYRQSWEKTASVSEVLLVKTLAEFERSYFEMAGYSDYTSYSQATNPIYVFENIKIPLLVLNAEDDPVCHIKNFEPYKDMIGHMPNIAVITTKKGSHCGFYQGLAGAESWATKLIADFLKHEQQKC